MLVVKKELSCICTKNESVVLALVWKVIPGPDKHANIRVMVGRDDISDMCSPAVLV